MYSLYFYCRGEKTMTNFYKMAEKSCEECQQLAPAMDFDLFAGYFLWDWQIISSIKPMPIPSAI